MSDSLNKGGGIGFFAVVFIVHNSLLVFGSPRFHYSVSQCGSLSLSCLESTEILKHVYTCLS